MIVYLLECGAALCILAGELLNDSVVDDLEQLEEAAREAAILQIERIGPCHHRNEATLHTDTSVIWSPPSIWAPFLILRDDEHLP